MSFFGIINNSLKTTTSYKEIKDRYIKINIKFYKQVLRHYKTIISEPVLMPNLSTSKRTVQQKAYSK